MNDSYLRQQFSQFFSDTEYMHESVETPPAAPSSPSLTLRSFSSRGWLVIIATFCIDRVILRSFLSVPDRLETPKKNDKYQARTRYYSVVGAT